MSHTTIPAVPAVEDLIAALVQLSESNPEQHHYHEMDMICARKNALTERIRSVDPLAALAAPDLPIYWAALRLAATRKDIYDALAHVRCIHDPVSLRLDWLDAIVDVDPKVIAALEPEIEAAIAARRSHDVFVAWAHACHDDEAWEVLRAARTMLGGDRR